MSRYTCHYCKEEHGTENIVAYCAVCFAAKDQMIKRLEDRISHARTLINKLLVGEKFNKSDWGFSSSLPMKDNTAALESRFKAAEKIIQAARELNGCHCDHHESPNYDVCTYKIKQVLAQYDAESAK